MTGPARGATTKRPGEDELHDIAFEEAGLSSDDEFEKARDAAIDGLLDEDRMYQLVRQTRGIEDRTVEVTFAAPGARAYVFTFG